MVQGHSILLDKSITLRYTNSMKTTIAETLVEWDDNKNKKIFENMGSALKPLR